MCRSTGRSKEGLGERPQVSVGGGRGGVCGPTGRSKGLVTNYGEGGGGVKLYPYEKGGGAEKVLAMLKGEGYNKFWGRFYGVA